jgi:diketogulonate reductase-like aldo/keto reductase
VDLERIYGFCKYPPVVNQIEFHPCVYASVHLHTGSKYYSKRMLI